MNLVTSGIILYSFYICVCMDPEGSEPEKKESGIRFYGDGEPVKSDMMSSDDESSADLGSPMCTPGVCGPPTPGHGTPGYPSEAAEGYGTSDYAPYVPLPYGQSTPGSYGAPGYGYYVPGGYGTPRHSTPQGYRTPVYCPCFPGPYGTPGATGYGGYIPQGPYGARHSYYSPGGYGSPRYPTQPSPYGATSGDGAGASGDAGSPGQQTDQPSGPPTRAPDGTKLFSIDAKTGSNDPNVIVKEYISERHKRFHRRLNPKAGFGFNSVSYNGVPVWEMRVDKYATEVLLFPIGSRQKTILILLIDGIIKTFKRKGKNKPWKEKDVNIRGELFIRQALS
uniref:Uncharacterized protein n=1 Tax=Theileria annulata TaxID=5874 RepID=A0A3B0N7W8_THEAN